LAVYGQILQRNMPGAARATERAAIADVSSDALENNVPNAGRVTAA
jgi:hypothetical protein